MLFLISTHAPLAGRDNGGNDAMTLEKLFQPTRPLRGATLRDAWTILPIEISTHAPLAGRDLPGLPPCQRLYRFQPTRPLRGATIRFATASPKLLFQPTRPLRGATMGAFDLSNTLDDFNPRAPCGARQQKCTYHYVHFCDNRQISDAFAQNAACQGTLLLLDAEKPCGFRCEPPG